MRVTAERQDADIAILHLDGRLDLVSAATVKSEILKMVNDGHPRVVVDLQGVPFIDSSGLGALIGGLRAARTAGGDLRIANVGEQARMILQLTTLDRVLTPHSDIEAALAQY